MPARESKLTMLLQHALCGHAAHALVVVACCSPCSSDAEHTLNTVRNAMSVAGGAVDNVRDGRFGLLTEQVCSSRSSSARDPALCCVECHAVPLDAATSAHTASQLLALRADDLCVEDLGGKLGGGTCGAGAGGPPEELDKCRPGALAADDGSRRVRELLQQPVTHEHWPGPHALAPAAIRPALRQSRRRCQAAHALAR